MQSEASQIPRFFSGNGVAAAVRMPRRLRSGIPSMRAWDSSIRLWIGPPSEQHLPFCSCKRRHKTETAGGIYVLVRLVFYSGIAHRNVLTSIFYTWLLDSC